MMPKETNHPIPQRTMFVVVVGTPTSSRSPASLVMIRALGLRVS